MNKQIKVSLVGNPNTGKTSLFNQLTGLNQKVGNYSGVTVDKKQGICKLSENQTARVIDLPGTYSINPTSLDETVVVKELFRKDLHENTDVVLVVCEVENLKRNLFLFSQIKDLGLPTVLIINMSDQMSKKGISLDVPELQKQLGVEIILMSTRNSEKITEIKQAILSASTQSTTIKQSDILSKIDSEYFDNLEQISSELSPYHLWLMITQNFFPDYLKNSEKNKLIDFQSDLSLVKKYQHKESIYRYQQINQVLKSCYTVDRSKANSIRNQLDAIFTHTFLGYIIFFGLLSLIFQSIFEWSSIPMDFIDGLFSNFADYTRELIPQGKLSDLICDGIIPGLGGVFIFIPQIVILFSFIATLEESGYMSRVVFLMDKIMRKFGMNGKSIIPLISGTACAIPAVMATRTIKNWKERLVTIMIVPFITCAARLPVYAILIAIVIPQKRVLGFVNLQGITLMGLYILGFLTAIIAAFLMDKVLKNKYPRKEFFIVEMPDYKVPSLKNIFFEVFEKTKSFILDAGKVILAISIVLWFLASHGPSGYHLVEHNFKESVNTKQMSNDQIDQKIASLKLEKSYIGILGKTIEPLVQPLGYDWKIGIGLITSFAAREVFVGTLATIYSIENQDDESSIKERMRNEINSETGKKRFDLATGMSLLLFYAFAMQCMATLAIVKRETKSWKWPLMQLVVMGFIAYFSALITYQILC